MATFGESVLPEGGVKGSESSFFLTMAIIMVAVVTAGFTVNLAMGRSTFAVPWPYHVHALVFFGWAALYLAQSFTIARGHVQLHRSLGRLAYGWIPAMVAIGVAIIIIVMRRTGGPFFFAQNEFLFSNILLLFTFGFLSMIALRQRRYTGWHRRLMMSAMSTLTGPGLGRLLPMPLMIPYAWKICIAITLLFPVAGMIADKRRYGRVHPAWWWGAGSIALVQIAASLLASSSWGVGVTKAIIAGYPGSARPIEAFLPPGF